MGPVAQASRLCFPPLKLPSQPPLTLWKIEANASIFLS
jgi:hypothetical protein